MSNLVDPAWRQEEEPDWPSQAEMDEMAAEMTEENWEADWERLIGPWCRPLPLSLTVARDVPNDEEEAA